MTSERERTFALREQLHKNAVEDMKREFDKRWFDAIMEEIHRRRWESGALITEKELEVGGCRARSKLK